MADKKLIFCGNSPAYLKEELTKESNESNGATAFRIPSLVNAGGTLVAVADKASSGDDWGFIELAVRTSEDGGKTWSDIKTIATPPARETTPGTTSSAFFIDPCMSVASNGNIVMLVTFFPECKGIHDRNMLDKKKIAYASFDGKNRQVIYDRDGNYYMVLEDGTVIDASKKKTPYKVTDWKGSLEKDGEYVGNIYLNGEKGREHSGETTFGAPLKAPKRSYIFALKSTDKGATWSEPKDITADLLSPEDGVFLAVAPGSGLTLKSGRIVMPAYSFKGTAAIYSDDNGETWNRLKQALYTGNIDEWCAIEGPDKIYSFGRARKYGKTPVAVSDNGIIWSKAKAEGVKAPKCQKSALMLGDKILISHPSGKKREKGVISVGTFVYDKKQNVKGIKWSKEDIIINDGFFAYSCLAPIDSNTVGVLYEDEPSSHIVFETFKIS